MAVGRADRNPDCRNLITCRHECDGSVGFIAGILTTAGSLPQLVKTYHARSADGLSFKMLVTLAVGLAMWTIYGLMSKSLPVTITDAVGLMLFIALIGMKLHFDSRPTKD